MAIEVVCPACDAPHKVKDESAGKKLKCKGCGTAIPIPKGKGASKTPVADDDDFLNMDLSDQEQEEDAEIPAPQSKRRKSGTASKVGRRELNLLQQFLLYALQHPWVGVTIFFVCVWMPLSFVFPGYMMLADVAIAALCAIGLAVGTILALIGVTFRNPFQMLHVVTVGAVVGLLVPPELRGAANYSYAKATDDALGKAHSTMDTGIAGSIAVNCGIVMGIVVAHMFLFFMLKNAGVVRFMEMGM